MEHYQLRTIVAVAVEVHLMRAAEKLFSSQLAVSAPINGLENEPVEKFFAKFFNGYGRAQSELVEFFRSIWINGYRTEHHSRSYWKKVRTSEDS